MSLTKIFAFVFFSFYDRLYAGRGLLGRFFLLFFWFVFFFFLRFVGRFDVIYSSHHSEKEVLKDGSILFSFFLFFLVGLWLGSGVSINVEFPPKPSRTLPQLYQTSSPCVGLTVFSLEIVNERAFVFQIFFFCTVLHSHFICYSNISFGFPAVPNPIAYSALFPKKKNQKISVLKILGSLMFFQIPIYLCLHPDGWHRRWVSREVPASTQFYYLFQMT